MWPANYTQNALRLEGIFPHLHDNVKPAANFTARREKKQWLVEYRSEKA